MAEGAEGPVDEGLDSEPQEDFDLSFAPEGETEGPGPETAAGDEDTTEAAAEAASEADTAPEGPAGEPGESAAAPEAPPDEAPSEEAAAGEAPGPGEEEPPRSGFDAVYGMGDSTGAATQGQAVAEAGEGAGDKEKKVIPITVGVKKSDESAVRVPDFSEVFSHVISKDDIFAHGAGEGGEEERGPEEAAPVRRREAGPKKPSSARLGLLVAGLIIILGGAGLYASGIIETVTSSIAPGPARVRSVSIEKLSGRVMENVSAGRLFAIEAVVKNRTDEPQEIKTVRGTLYDKSGTRLAGRTVSPGRVLSPGDLRSLSRAEIERHFKDSSGGTIPPRGIVPVMVVFTEIPPGVGEYGLDIVR